jgi:hypothetical protein
MSVKYATPNSSKLNNFILNNGLSISLAGTNSCAGYLSKRRKDAEHKKRALAKCKRILEKIHREKCSELDRDCLGGWLEDYDRYIKMLELSDVSQLDYLLVEYSRAKLPEKKFMEELQEL